MTTCLAPIQDHVVLLIRMQNVALLICCVSQLSRLRMWTEDTIDRPVLIGTLHACKCTCPLLIKYDDKNARASGLVLTGFLVSSSNLAETSLSFLGRIRTNTVPTSGHTRSSFSISAMPRKPVAPVMKMFFPLKKSLTGLMLSSMSAMVELSLFGFHYNTSNTTSIPADFLPSVPL